MTATNVELSSIHYSTDSREGHLHVMVAGECTEADVLGRLPPLLIAQLLLLLLQIYKQAVQNRQGLGSCGGRWAPIYPVAK